MPESSPGVVSWAMGICVTGAGVDVTGLDGAAGACRVSPMVSRETSPALGAGAGAAVAVATGGAAGAAAAAGSAAALCGATMSSAIGAKAISSR